MNVVDRFLKYVTFDTTSDEKSEAYPSTKEQVVLLNYLATELIDLGLEVDFDGKYVIASLPKVESGNTICFIAHVDTSPAVSGKNIKPIITVYDGNGIVLPHTSIAKSDLIGLEGQRIITSDGSTLLGADDKAGVAEIMCAVEKLVQNTKDARCNLKVVFTPDEEIGRGTEQLDISKVGADYGYTVDGGLLGEIEYENFNAASFKLRINGRNIHPGSAKNVMKNAIDMFVEFHALLPENERPVNTEGYEGFYMANEMEGSVERVDVSYIIRDHDKERFEQKKAFAKAMVERMNQKYGEGTFDANITDSYYNMKEVIAKNFHLVENAKTAFARCGVVPYSKPIRGGTDGAMLSLKGLPCPNLSTGGANFHAKEEFVPVESLEKMVEVLIELAKIYA